MVTQTEHWELMYQQHRLRVLNAKSVINSLPPQPKDVDGSSSGHRQLSYLEMLMQLSGQPSRSGSFTFTKTPDCVQRPYRSQTRCAKARSKASLKGSSCSALFNAAVVGKVRRGNGGQLAQSNNNSQTNSNNDISRHDEIPEYVLQRYDYFRVPHNVSAVRRLLRPRIFLDLEEKNARPLGRLVIQLYTEACPEVVLEFVRACTTHAWQNFTLTRLFSQRWLEGELALQDHRTLTTSAVEHDLEAIDHGSSAGILSFPSRYVRGLCKRRSLSFHISFKPFTVLNGKRIAFGRVRRGTNLLDTLQDFNTKNGKPLHEIAVGNCGLLM